MGGPVTGTELRGKNLVASRARKFKKLLALTKIQWPSIMHKNALVDIICLSEQTKNIFFKDHMSYMVVKHKKPFNGKCVFSLQ